MMPVGVNAENVVDFRTRYGPTQFCRVFLQTQDWSLSDARVKEALAAHARGETIVITMKVNSVTAAAGGSDDARQKRILEGLIAAGITDFIWGVYHEPENDVKNGTFTSDQWKAMQKHMLPLAKAIIGPVGGRTIFILMSWTANPKSGRNVDDYLIAEADLVGWDVYEKAGNPSGSGVIWATKDPSTMPVDEKKAPDATHPPEQIGLFGFCIDVSNRWGKPWMVTEFGCLRREADTTGAERGKYFEKVAASPRMVQAEAIIYYEVGPPRFNYAFRTEAAGIAGFKKIGAIVKPVDPPDPTDDCEEQLASAEAALSISEAALAASEQALTRTQTDLTTRTQERDAARTIASQLQAKATKYDAIAVIVEN